MGEAVERRNSRRYRWLCEVD